MDFSLFSSSLVLRHVSVVSLEAFRSRLASESRQGLQRQEEKNAQIGPIKRGIRKKRFGYLFKPIVGFARLVYDALRVPEGFTFWPIQSAINISSFSN
jgi:hypothetical protein